jgi:hypothetical protein
LNGDSACGVGSGVGTDSAGCVGTSLIDVSDVFALQIGLDYLPLRVTGCALYVVVFARRRVPNVVRE